MDSTEQMLYEKAMETIVKQAKSIATIADALHIDARYVGDDELVEEVVKTVANMEYEYEAMRGMYESILAELGAGSCAEAIEAVRSLKSSAVTAVHVKEQVDPQHYRIGGVEAIDVMERVVRDLYGEEGVEAARLALGLKYVLRAGHKGPLEVDAGKAANCLHRWKHERFLMDGGR